jgi:hypothetical protein
LTNQRPSFQFTIFIVIGGLLIYTFFGVSVYIKWIGLHPALLRTLLFGLYVTGGLLIIFWFFRSRAEVFWSDRQDPKRLRFEKDLGTACYGLVGIFIVIVVILIVMFFFWPDKL